MKTRYNSFDHFLETCANKSSFSFYGVDTLPFHPAHFWAEKDYFVTDLYLQFAQGGGNKGPYTIFIPIQIWVPDHMGDIKFSELSDFRDEIECITFYDEELEINRTDPDDHDFEVILYLKNEIRKLVKSAKV